MVDDGLVGLALIGSGGFLQVRRGDKVLIGALQPHTSCDTNGGAVWCLFPPRHKMLVVPTPLSAHATFPTTTLLHPTTIRFLSVSQSCMPSCSWRNWMSWQHELELYPFGFF